MLERLQAELSTCMYSEQGLEPLMRAVLAQVCQSLIVVSNCMPGSPHSQAACEIARSTSRGVDDLDDLAVGDARAAPRGRRRSPRVMKSSVARTELLAFWNWTLAQASPLSDMSQPAAPRS